MNKLRIRLTSSDFSGLKQSGGNYVFTVDLLNQQALPLNNVNVPNTTILEVAPVGDELTLDIPITDATYSIPMIISVNGNSDNSCCIMFSNYTLVNSANPSTSFSPRIYMNTSGYGFDPNEATGISDEWRARIEAFNSLSHNGQTFSGINGVRLCVKWNDYEPTEGNYNDTKLIAAINYCKSKGLRFAVCFWPIRMENDGFLPDGDKATGNLGTIFKVENKYTFAPYSLTARAKLVDVVTHLAEVMQQFSDDVDYISLAYGDTEEFYNPIIRWAGVTPQLTGYSTVDREAWTTYSASRGIPGTPVQVSPDATDAWATGDYWNTMTGRIWYDFITKGLSDVHAAFRDAVHNGGGRVCGFYADAGGTQSAWYMTYRLNKIFEGSDVVYSSEGGTKYDLAKKLFSADVNLGTFPNAEPAIEFDPEDLNTDTDGLGYGKPTSSANLLSFGTSFFRRGGKIIHFALAFSPGDQGVNNIQMLAPALWDLQQNYCLSNATVVPLPSDPQITFDLTSYSGDAGYVSLWNNSGAGLNKQLKVNLIG